MITERLCSDPDALPSATKILQPKDRYALSSAKFTLRSADFESRSGHLYNARQLLHGRCAYAVDSPMDC
jgi:hypothetical protein